MRVEDIQELWSSSRTVSTLGLYEGKAGFLVLLSIMKNLTTENAKEIDNIIEEIQADISEGAHLTDFSYSDGILGLGWGINTIYTNGFITENEKEVLDSFDDEIYKTVMQNETAAMSLSSGLIGMINYYLYRVSSKLKEISKHRYIVNYEVLVLQSDLFLKELDVRLRALEELNGLTGNVLLENEFLFSNSFNLLVRLRENGVSSENVEIQTLLLAKIFISFFEQNKKEIQTMVTTPNKYWILLSMLNCLKKFSQKYVFLQPRISSIYEKISGCWNIQHMPCVNAKQLTVKKDFLDNPTFLLDDDTADSSYDKKNIGISGFYGSQCLLKLIARSEDTRLFNNCFLL